MQRVQRDSESKRLLWGIHFHFFCTFISFIRPFNAIIGSLFFVLYWLFLLFLLRRQQMLSGVLLSSFRDPPKWRKLGEPSRIRTHRMTFIIKILPLDYRHIHHSKFRKLHCQPPFHWSSSIINLLQRQTHCRFKSIFHFCNPMQPFAFAIPQQFFSSPFLTPISIIPSTLSNIYRFTINCESFLKSVFVSWA